MLRFMYFAPRDLVIPRVDRTCIMRFCEALAQQGCDVEAVCLRVRLEFDEPTRTKDLFDVYGVRTRFLVTQLPSFMRQSRDRGGRLWRATAYGAHALRRLSSTNALTIAYFKNYLIGIPLLVLRHLFGRGRLLLLFEIHVPPSNALSQRLLRHFDGLIPVSEVLGDELKRMGLSARRILVAHQGVDLSYVESVRLGRNEAREELGLPRDRRFVVYTGKVHANSQEMALLLETAARLPTNVDVVIVGGREDEVATLRDRVNVNGQRNVRFVGFVAPADVFHYQMAADVLVSYYPSDLEINKYRASPGKLFEYMASKRPIVTADFPALREVLKEGTAVFVKPDDPDALAANIMAVLDDGDRAASLASAAYKRVARYSWEERAHRVCSFASTLAGH